MSRDACAFVLLDTTTHVQKIPMCLYACTYLPNIDPQCGCPSAVRHITSRQVRRAVRFHTKEPATTATATRKQQVDHAAKSRYNYLQLQLSRTALYGHLVPSSDRRDGLPYQTRIRPVTSASASAPASAISIISISSNAAKPTRQRMHGGKK